MTDNHIMRLASLDDLIVTKLNVIFQRAGAKDYFDIAAMINAGVSFSRGITSARQLFRPNFQPSASLKALTYFNDGELQTLSPEMKSTLVESVVAVKDLPKVELISPSLCD